MRRGRGSRRRGEEGKEDKGDLNVGALGLCGGVKSSRSPRVQVLVQVQVQVQVLQQVPARRSGRGRCPARGGGGGRIA